MCDWSIILLIDYSTVWSDEGHDVGVSHNLRCRKLIPLCDVIVCVLWIVCHLLFTLAECVWWCRLFGSACRPPWSLCQSGCGRFRAMPLYRHCEEHTWPQVESTLWPVSSTLTSVSKEEKKNLKTIKHELRLYLERSGCCIPVPDDLWDTTEVPLKREKMHEQLFSVTAHTAYHDFPQ